jgi:hypothetical protein
LEYDLPYDENLLDFIGQEHNGVLGKNMIDTKYFKIRLLDFVRENGVVVGFW